VSGRAFAFLDRAVTREMTTSSPTAWRSSVLSTRSRRWSSASASIRSASPSATARARRDGAGPSRVRLPTVASYPSVAGPTGSSTGPPGFWRLGGRDRRPGIGQDSARRGPGRCRPRRGDPGLPWTGRSTGRWHTVGWRWTPTRVAEPKARRGRGRCPTYGCPPAPPAWRRSPPGCPLGCGQRGHRLPCAAQAHPLAGPVRGWS
jgi:hypothetical protein